MTGDQNGKHGKHHGHSKLWGKHHFVLLLAFFNLDGPSIFPKFNFY